jgi:hypothetical protein
MQSLKNLPRLQAQKFVNKINTYCETWTNRATKLFVFTPCNNLFALRTLQMGSKFETLPLKNYLKLATNI